MGGADRGSEESTKAQGRFSSILDASGRDSLPLPGGDEAVGVFSVRP